MKRAMDIPKTGCNCNPCIIPSAFYPFCQNKNKWGMCENQWYERVISNAVAFVQDLSKEYWTVLDKEYWIYDKWYLNTGTKIL